MMALFISCNKDDEEVCEEVIENSGIIVESVNISSCAEPFYTGNFVIQSEAELTEALNQTTGCEKPTIDFTQYTLLGRYAFTSGTGSYYRNVDADTANSQYDFTITVENCGTCNCLNQNMNWVLVPKLPDDWTVTFTVK